MRYQTTEYNCGPAALQNALRVLRHRVSQARIATLAGTTDAGTDEDGLKRAALALGHTVDEFAETEAVRAWGLLGYSLLVGRPVVLAVDRWGHWITAIALVGAGVLLYEPARFGYAVRENGVVVATRGKLMKRWRAARRVARDSPPYYGLAIG